MISSVLDWVNIFKNFEPGFVFGLGIGLIAFLLGYGINLILCLFKRII